MRSFFVGLAAVVAILANYALPASAAQITGTITLMGEFQPTISGVATQNMALANGIDFLPLGGSIGTFSTGTGNGDLAPFANSTGGSISDFTFTPFAPVSGFYSITSGSSTLSFDLNSVTVATQTSNFLNLTGSGTVHVTGFDDTAGNWNLSGQSSNGAASGATFSWTAGTTAFPQSSTGIPEPGTLALLGLGLLAGGYCRRQRK